MVDGLDPAGEQLVQGDQVGDGRERPGDLELDEELFADGPEQPLDLPAAGWLAGLGVGQLDAQDGEGPQQLGGDHRAAVVEVDDLRDTAGGQAGAERSLKPDGVFAVTPPVADQGA